jgi:phage shock protein A
VDTLSEKVAMLERIIRSHEETIADLRGQLAATTALASQLSSVIAELKPPKARPGWWARLLGG